MADEALTNKAESREALSFVSRLVVIPLVTGALISRAIADPVLSFSLQVGLGVCAALLDVTAVARCLCVLHHTLNATHRSTPPTHRPAQNNPNAFTLTEHQKLEGAQALHMEETRLKMMMAIGQIPPLDEAATLQHLHEFAVEVGWWACVCFCRHVAAVAKAQTATAEGCGPV
jgi:hypothetical protein